MPRKAVHDVRVGDWVEDTSGESHEVDDIESLGEEMVLHSGEDALIVGRDQQVAVGGGSSGCLQASEIDARAGGRDT